MEGKRAWTRWLHGVFNPDDRKREQVVEILQHRYMREKQHAMRYAAQADHMQYPQFKAELLRMAEDEERHAAMIAEKLRLLGGEIPTVVPVRLTAENSWQYLRTDLAEEQRCAGELALDLPHLSGEFPEILAMLERIEADGKVHRAKIRDMLMRSDPQSLWPA